MTFVPRRSGHGLHGRHRGAWRLGLALFCGALIGATVQAQGEAAALQQQRAALQPQLKASAFGQPLVLTSRESADALAGDVHAEMPQAFGRLVELFRSGPAMCEMLLLHLNVRGCRAGGQTASSGPGSIVLLAGPKQVDAASLLHPMRCSVQLQTSAVDYVRLTLTAPQGPPGTRDYRIVVEATPIDSSRSFVRLSYGFRFGLMGRTAMQVYLATAGRAKTGFTVETAADGKPQPVRGARAALERNVMRYYLALLAYGQVEGAPGGERTQARMRRWFALSEQYAAQLHELTLEDYLQEKRRDLDRPLPEGS